MTKKTKINKIKDIRFGQMNPLDDSVGRSSFDPSRVHVTSTMRSSNANYFTANLLKGKRRWNAIVLRSTKQSNPWVASNFQRTMASITKEVSNEISYYVYKVFIAELDGFKKLPTKFSGDADENLINICRDAVSPMGKNWGFLDYGTPVEVVFDNQEKSNLAAIITVHHDRRIPLGGEEKSKKLFATAGQRRKIRRSPKSTVGGQSSRKSIYIPTQEVVANADLPADILKKVTINGDTITILQDMEEDLMALITKYEEVFPGKRFRVSNSYRDYDTQKDLYDCWQREQAGEDNDCNLAAAPGTSRHGWGAAVDLRSKPMFGAGSYDTKTQSLQFRWLNRYGENYKFIFNVKGEAWHMGWTGTSAVLRGVAGNLTPRTNRGRPEGPADLVVSNKDNPTATTG
jgi:hypothetical protein